MTEEARCPDCGAPFRINGSTLRICADSHTFKRTGPTDDWVLASPPLETWTPAPPEPLPNSHLLRLSLVDREEVHWLWRPYIPLGKLTLLEGDPGRR